MDRLRTFEETVLFPLILSAAICLVYSNVRNAPFILDDPINILYNNSIRNPSDITAVLRGSGETGIAGRPIANLSFALNYAFFRYNPRGYHIFNIIIHAGCALFLFGIVRRSLLLPPLCSAYKKHAALLAFFCSLIWALHPLCTESVSYVTQRIESLMAFFFLGIFYCAVRARNSGKPWLWHIFCALFMLLGAGTKEVIVAAPVMVYLYDRIFQGRGFWEALRRSPILYAGMAAGLALLFVLVAWGQTASKAYDGRDPSNHLTYFLNQPSAVWRYLKLAVLPRDLCFDYGWPSDGVFGKPHPPLWKVASLGFPLAFLFAASLFMAGLRNEASALAAGKPRSVFFRFRSFFSSNNVSVAAYLVLWFFIILAPTSSFLPLFCTAAEQRAYLPLAGIAVLFVFTVTAIFKAEQPAWILLIIVAVCLGITTFHRNGDYRSELAIWSDTVRKLPGNSRAQGCLGKALYEANRVEEAIKALELAILLNPRHPPNYRNLGLMLAETGQPERGLALAGKAVAMDPDDPENQRIMGGILLKLHRNREALAFLQKAVAILPDSILARTDLGAAYIACGMTLPAVGELKRILEQVPDLSIARINLAVALMKLSDMTGAEAELRKGVTLDPHNVNVAMALGELYEREGKNSEALDVYNKLLALRPDFEDARKKLAGLMK